MLDLNIVKTFTHVIQIIVLSLCCWGIVVMCLWVDLVCGGNVRATRIQSSAEVYSRRQVHTQFSSLMTL